MSNKDLLKQAIAEAKTIREAAIANAKEALEETLTPHLKEMLAQKLQEMEDKEEMEESTVNQAGFEDYSEDPKKHGNIGDINEEEEEEEEAPEGEEGEEEEELEIEDMSVEDLKNLIRDIVAQEVGHDEEAEEAPEGDDLTSVDDSEEIDINELLAELEGMGKKVKEGYTQGTKEIPGKPTHSYSKTAGSKRDDVSGTKGDGYKVVKEQEVDEYGSGYMEDPSDSAARGLENIISMIKSIKNSETLAKVKEFLKALPAAAGSAMRSEGMDKEEMEEYGSGYAEDPSDSAARGLENIISMIKSIKNSETLAKVKEFLKALPAAAGSAMRSERAEQDLQEALKAVRILRNQLQEVNLLNAKLLYVNKVFKSTNLSEGQKVNVIAAFDKAETVKEVKLVFETVSKNVVAKPAAIKEHRSFASKATGNAQTTAPKEIISEVSEQVQRWQKLAGIIKS